MAIKRGKREVKTGRAASKQSTVGKPSTRRPNQSTYESKSASPKRVTPRAQAGAERSESKTAKPRSIVKRAAASVGRALSKVTGRGKTTATKAVARPKVQRAERVPKREADIPMDRIAATYTPTQTSLKSPFRTSGADQQQDQEFARGVADDRWNDEDILTNKSGDPRIGTHGRTYEPGEARAASGRNRNRQ